jgi:hypothetical protein
MVWKTVDRRVVGQVSVGRAPTAPVTPPITLPITPPITPPVAATFLADHKKIKKYIDSQGKKYLCPLIDEIAGTTGLSEDVVRLHLDVMDEDESIAVVGKGTNPPVCGVDGLSRLVVNLRKLVVR